MSRMLESTAGGKMQKLTELYHSYNMLLDRKEYAGLPVVRTWRFYFYGKSVELLWQAATDPLSGATVTIFAGQGGSHKSELKNYNYKPKISPQR